MFADGRHVGKDGENDDHAVADAHAVVGVVLVVHEERVKGEAPEGEEDSGECHERPPIHRHHEVRILVI